MKRFALTFITIFALAGVACSPSSPPPKSKPNPSPSKGLGKSVFGDEDKDTDSDQAGKKKKNLFSDNKMKVQVSKKSEKTEKKSPKDKGENKEKKAPKKVNKPTLPEAPSLSHQTKKQIDSLVAKVKSDDWVVQFNQLNSLGYYTTRGGARSEKLVQVVVEGLGHKEWPIRALSVRWLGYLVQSHPQLGEKILDKLAAKLKDREPNVRYWSAVALRYFIGHPKRAVAHLKKALEEEKVDEVEEQLLLSLAKYGTKAAPADKKMNQYFKKYREGFRVAATFGLVRLKGKSKDNSPLLIEALANKSDMVRVLAAQGLASRGKTALPHLLQAFKDKNDKRRQGVMWALSQMNFHSPETIKTAIAGLGDSDSRVRTSAWEVVIDGGKEAVPRLVDLILNPKTRRDTRIIAASALTQIQPRPEKEIALLIDKLAAEGSWKKTISTAREVMKTEELPSLVNQLHDHLKRANWREKVVIQLVAGQHSNRFKPLVWALIHRKKVVRTQAFEALQNFGPQVLPQLLDAALRSPRREIQEGVYQLLIEYGPCLTTRIQKQLENYQVRMRDLVTKVIRKYNPQRALLTFMGYLNHEKKWTRKGAIKALGYYMDRVTWISPIIEEALFTDRDGEVRQQALESLEKAEKKISHERYFYIFLSAFSDPHGKVRQKVARHLSRLSPLPKEVIQSYLLALEDPSRPVRRAVVEGLIHAEQNESILPILTKILGDEDSNTRGKGVQMLRKMGLTALPNLKKSLRDPRWLARMEAAELIGHLGEKGVNASLALAKRLTDPKWKVRLEVVRALGKIGPKARSAHSKLYKCLKSDDNWKVRKEVVRTLFLMGKTGRSMSALKKAAKDDGDYRVRSSAKSVATRWESQ